MVLYDRNGGLKWVKNYLLNQGGEAYLIHLRPVLHFMQKQPPEVFCEKRCFQKFRKIHRKTPVPENTLKTLENTLACNFIKKESLAQVFSCKFCEISKNTFSYRTAQMTASVCRNQNTKSKMNYSTNRRSTDMNFLFMLFIFSFPLFR